MTHSFLFFSDPSEVYELAKEYIKDTTISVLCLCNLIFILSLTAKYISTCSINLQVDLATYPAFFAMLHQTQLIFRCRTRRKWNLIQTCKYFKCNLWTQFFLIEPGSKKVDEKQGREGSVWFLRRKTEVVNQVSHVNRLIIVHCFIA